MSNFKERFAMWLAWRWAQKVLGDLVHIDELTEYEMQSTYRIDQLEQRVEGLQTKLSLCEMALRVAHLPLPPYEAALAEEKA